MKKMYIFGNVKRGVAYRPVNIPKTLKQLYYNQIPITKSKYNDLKQLCMKNIIPFEHHCWYTALPHTDISKKSTLEDDCEESD